MAIHTVCVATVTFNNSAEQLERFARCYRKAAALARGVGVAVELRYLDNGAPSNLDALIGAGAQAITMAPGGNLGYGPGMAGLWEDAFAHGVDAVVSANPDGGFHPDCIALLAGAAAAAPQHLYEARQFPAEHAKPYHPTSGETPWASGCCVLVTRDLFSAVGGIDPQFWLYMEDVDYSWRVRLANRQVFMVPQALYAHDTAQRTISDAARFQMWRAGRRLGWKWGSAAFVARCEAYLGANFPNQLLEVLDTPPVAEYTAERLAQVCDFSHGFHFAKTRWSGA